MLTENELANITEEGKAEIYKRVLERVTYYSFKGHHKGYIEIVYKNGHISRYLYLNNNQCCRFWVLPEFYTIDIENMIISSKGVKRSGKHIDINILPETYTLAEYQKAYRYLMITYK